MRKGRVLVVEDEFEIGLDIQRTLSDAGFEVSEPILTLEDGLVAAEKSGFDVAVLDANLNGKNVGPLAAALKQRRIPFVVVSGYAREFLPLDLAHAPLISKPFERSRLIGAVEAVCRSVAMDPTLSLTEPLP